MNERDDIYSQKFESIYKNGLWGGTTTPKSGSGSTFQAALPYVEIVQKLVRDEGIISVLDIGHGDWEMWESYKFDDTNYIGIDVYAELTRELNKRLGSTSREFICLNAATQELPKAEICITKDVLQHLTNDDVSNILKKMQDYRFLVICNDFYQFNFLDTYQAIKRFISLRERIFRIKKSQNPFFLKLKRRNSDIEIGSHRCLDLEASKFAKLLSTHELQLIKDFPGKEIKRPNLVKRVYVYKKRASDTHA